MTTTASEVADSLARHNVRVGGAHLGRPIVFGQGFGCDHTMWRQVAPQFEADHRVVLFDQVGAGSAAPSAYRPSRYGSLLGHAEDLLELLETLALGPVAFVGHSGAAMVGVLAAVRRPDLFSALVLLAGSPRYVDDHGYPGAFSRYDVDELVAALERDYPAWCRSFAPMLAGNPDRPGLAEELTRSFLSTDPRVALDLSRALLLSDHRAELGGVRTPTLVVQSTDDPMVPAPVAEYLHRHIRGSRYAVLGATGHVAPLSGPDETGAVIAAFLAEVAR